MPTTYNGEFVYSEPEETKAYTQTAADQFGLSTQGDPSEWEKFLQKRQVEAKARIDEYTGSDFENHANETIVIDGGANRSRFVDLPTPVQAVNAVRIDGVELDASEYRLGDDGQLIRLANETETAEEQLLDLGGHSHLEPGWPTGYGNIEVDLDRGYDSVPPDIAEAEMKLVAHTITGLVQMREGMVVQQDDIDVQIQLPSAMTSEIRAMLDAHRDSGRTMSLL